MAGDSGPDADTEIDVPARLGADPAVMWRALLRDCQPKKPLVAAVEGIAFAGGTELLQGTDIRVAGRSARFAVSEVKRSLYPMAGSAVRLRRQIPYTIAAEVLLAGRELTADEALHYGLIGHVVDDGQALTRAKEIGATIAECGPLAVEAILRTLRETEGMTEREALDHEFSYGQAVFATEDAKEGPRAFKEKRKANFTRR
jgi:enoyl-CoA hydratase